MVVRLSFDFLGEIWTAVYTFIKDFYGKCAADISYLTSSWYASKVFGRNSEMGAGVGVGGVNLFVSRKHRQKKMDMGRAEPRDHLHPSISIRHLSSCSDLGLNS